MRLATIALTVILLLGVARAQTEFPISANSPNLQAEYKKELDKWMVLAYEGSAEAQFKVGVLYTNQQFNAPDFEQAVYWYKQAARQGHTLAQYNLGHQYLTGVGVPQSETTAMSWWLKAAEQDHALAQFNIGRAYYLGIGLPQDLAESRRWFERAAVNQEPKSIEILEQLGWAKPGQYALTNKPPSKPAPSAADLVASSEPKQEPKQESKPVSKAEPSSENTDPQPEVISAKNTETNAADTSIETSDLPAAAPPAAPPAAPKRAVEDSAEPVARAAAPRREAPPTPSATTGRPDGWVTNPNLELPRKQRTEKRTTVSTAKQPTRSRGTNTIAVYTNPAIRSVLIAVVEQRDQLEVLAQTDEWTAVRSRRGFPVWVHGDFIVVADDIGTVTGSAVNARSVPIIIQGTVVGQLDKQETVAVVEQRGEWYRIISPARFQAWVKTSELASNRRKSKIDNE